LFANTNEYHNANTFYEIKKVVRGSDGALVEEDKRNTSNQQQGKARVRLQEPDATDSDAADDR